MTFALFYVTITLIIIKYYTMINELRDPSGDKIEIDSDIKELKINPFWSINWYKPWENEDSLIDFLNLYRTHSEQIIKQ